MTKPLPKIRFGLIGCGRIGATADDKTRQWAVSRWWLPLSHASAIAAVDDAELVAVCDVVESAARQARDRYRASAYYTDYREMLRTEKLDAVAIATRTEERKAILEECVSHGIRGVFCEKPLCLTLEDLDSLTSLLREHSVAFVYGTRRRFMPIFRRVKEEIARGRIGKVGTIVIRFGGGQLLWVHPHTVDLAAFFAGDASPAWIQADLDLDPKMVLPKAVDADPLVRAATMRFSNGITAQFVAAESYDVEIAGNEGMATIFSDGAGVEWRTRRDASDGLVDAGHLLHRQREDNTDTVSGTVESLRELIAALRGEPNCNYSLDVVTHNLEALFGMVYSHLDEGKRVCWPIERRGWKITGRIGELLP